MTAEQIARELGGRKSGAGWTCRCPAHDDRSPSLSITERDGKILVKCFAGCEQQAVIDALRSRGLWPEPERREWTPEEREAKRRDERDLRAARWFRLAAVALAENLLAEMPPCDLDRGPITRLLLDLRSGESTTLATYRSWREREPDLTSALVRAGRNSDERLQAMLARLIEKEGYSHAA